VDTINSNELVFAHEQERERERERAESAKKVACSRSVRADERLTHANQ
jgi:hypothetical protein